MPTPVTVFVDDATYTARSAEVPAAVWNSGMLGGGCAVVGIGPETELAQSLPNWTLLDQHGNARNGQIGQYIGGSGLGDGTEGTLPDSTVRVQDNETMDGTGALSFPAPNAILTDLAVGWDLQPPAPLADPEPPVDPE